MILKKSNRVFLFIMTILIIAGFSAPLLAGSPNPDNHDNEDQPIEIKDPYEKFNRYMFQFNEGIDKLVLKPVAVLYSKITPKPLAEGLTNFFNNIDMIPTVLNDFLQGNFYQLTSDTWRFGINSTVGILGFFDVASRIGLKPNSEDFGLTLAKWGYTNSNYLVLPLFGPSTVRDGIFGATINYYALSIYPHISATGLTATPEIFGPGNAVRYGLYFTGIVVKRADLLGYEKFMQQVALDKYLFVRSAYMQHRQYLIEGNKPLSNPHLEKNKLEEENASSTGV